MIEIDPNFKPMCDECEMFDPEMKVTRKYSNAKPYLTTVSILCAKRNECDNIERYLKGVTR